MAWRCETRNISPTRPSKQREVEQNRTEHANPRKLKNGHGHARRNAETFEVEVPSSLKAAR